MGYTISASIFMLHSHRWLNLHYTLCQQVGIGAQHPAQPRRRVAIELRELADADTGDGWALALQYYQRTLNTFDLLDPILKTIADQLVQHDDTIDIRTVALPPEHADVLAAADPVYRERLWPQHDVAHRAWIATLAPLIDQYGELILTQLAAAFQTGRPHAPLRVDLTAYAGWSGAYTTSNPPFPNHITIASTMAENQGWSGLEVVFHEAAHTVVSPIDGPLVESIARARTKYGDHGPRDLWHVVLFYTVGAIVQRVLARHGIDDYVPYADQYALYARVPGWRQTRLALAQHWQRYLDGQLSYDAAIAAVMRALQA
jgi:hypothetical protein